MPHALDAVMKEPAAAQARLVVYVSREQEQWIEQLQREARTSGRRLSASAVVRAALDQLREQG